MKKLVYYIWGILLLSLPLSHHGQTLVPSTASDAKLSEEKLSRIDELCEEYFQKGYLPGGTVLLARKGKIVYFKAWGEKDLDNHTAFQKDDIFRIASMTKAFTSVAIMQLFEQGKLGLDEPISNYLTSFKEMQVMDSFNPEDSTYTSHPAKTPITIRHLLTHTSGLSYNFSDPRMAAIAAKNKLATFDLAPNLTTAERIPQVAKMPLVAEPGTKFNYGVSTDVLGYLVQGISGLTLGEYCKSNIFEPLGMDDTGFYLPEDKHDRVIPVYYDTGKGLGKYPDSYYDFPMKKPMNYYSGGGGASSTTHDYAIFCQMLLNKGTYNGKRILSRRTVEMMTTDQLAFMDVEPGAWLGGKGEGFGLGFQIKTADAKAKTIQSPGTFSWGGIFNTKYWIDPKEEMVLVSMTQILPNQHQEFWPKLNSIIYSSIDD
ncbi:MAG: serine hydrolase domain-containing protein [Bacteroidota bacterium]